MKARFAWIIIMTVAEHRNQMLACLNVYISSILSLNISPRLDIVILLLSICGLMSDRWTKLQTVIKNFIYSRIILVPKFTNMTNISEKYLCCKQIKPDDKPHIQTTQQQIIFATSKLLVRK